MKMKKFIRKPNIEFEVGIIVEKDTNLKYETENVKTSINKLKLETFVQKEGENFKSELHTTIQLNEGDVLVFDKERGFIKPAYEEFLQVTEVINDLENIKELGMEELEYDITEKTKE